MGRAPTRTLKVSKLGALTVFSGTAFQSAMVRVCQFNIILSFLLLRLMDYGMNERNTPDSTT